MKTLPFLSFLILSTTFCISQTWVRTPHYEILVSPFHTDSMTVGPQEMSVAPNGTLFVLMQTSQEHNTFLYTVNDSGEYSWGNQVATYGGIFHEDAWSLHTTFDNGCIFNVRHDGSWVEDKIYKYGPTGNIQWTKSYVYLGMPDSLVLSVVPSYQKTYYVQKKNALDELDSLGQLMHSRSPFNATIYPVLNSEFLYQSGGAIIRENFAGISSWSIPDSSYTLLYGDSLFFYCRQASMVKKFDSQTGMPLWTKSITPYQLYFASDGNILSINSSGLLSRFDSSGNHLWTKTYDFPYFGITSAIIDHAGQVIAGGAYFSQNGLRLYERPFSSFLARVDSSGNGVIDSTNCFFSGNANINNKVTFADDACYVAAALGNSGPERDSLLRNDVSPSRSLYGTKWNTGFNAGINHLFSDVDGNGIIDTSDIAALALSLDVRNIPGVWRMQSGLPEVRVVCSTDTAYPGDTLELSVILGTTIGPVDSVYSISISISHVSFLSSATADIPVSALGDPSSNLFSYFATNDNYRSDLVLCRTDSLNAYVAGDTVARIFAIQTSTFSNLYPIIFDFNAISRDGYSIPMTPIIDSIYAIAITPGVEELSSNNFNIFPNPASNTLNIETISQDGLTFTIYNAIGQQVYSNSSHEHFSLDISFLPEGIYIIHIKQKDSELNRRFTISK